MYLDLLALESIDCSITIHTSRRQVFMRHQMQKQMDSSTRILIKMVKIKYFLKTRRTGANTDRLKTINVKIASSKFKSLVHILIQDAFQII